MAGLSIAIPRFRLNLGLWYYSLLRPRFTRVFCSSSLTTHLTATASPSLSSGLSRIASRYICIVNVINLLAQVSSPRSVATTSRFTTTRSATAARRPWGFSSTVAPTTPRFTVSTYRGVVVKQSSRKIVGCGRRYRRSHSTVSVPIPRRRAVDVWLSHRRPGTGVPTLPRVKYLCKQIQQHGVGRR